MAASKTKKKPRTPKASVLLPWCLVGAAVLVGVLYYRPISSYVETRAALEVRADEVAVLKRERQRLRARLAASATVEALEREARRMQLVRPGEKLFIVKGADEWRRANARRAATVGPDG